MSLSFLITWDSVYAPKLISILSSRRNTDSLSFPLAFDGLQGEAHPYILSYQEVFKVWAPLPIPLLRPASRSLR